MGPWSLVLGHLSLVICRATAVPSFRFQSLPAVVPACRNEGGFLVPGFRFPIPGDLPSARRRLAANPVGPSSAVLAVPLSLAPRAPFPVPRSPFPVPAFCPWHGCPQVSSGPFPGAYSVSFDSAKSYPQRRMPKRPCQKPSNSGQNRSKRRRFPSKRDQKGAHFVMPILTFGGVTPSGASARAVLGFRKVKKRVFGGPKCRVEKLSTKCGKL